MKRFIGLVLFILILMTVIVVVASKFFAEPQLKALIEQKGSEAISGRVNVQKVHIVFWPPVSLSLENLSAQTSKKPEFKLDIPKINLSLDPRDLIEARLVARVKVSKPQLEVTLPTTTTPQSATKKAAVGAGGGSFDVNNLKIALGLNLKLDDAKIEMRRGDQTYFLSKLNVDFLAPSIKSPWNLKITTDANNIPFELSSQFVFDGDHFQTHKTDLNFGGLKLDLAGQSTISTEEHKWDATLDIPELKNLIIPSQLEKTLKQWSGLLKGQVHAEHNKGAPWRAQGAIQANNLEAEVDLESSGDHLQGMIGSNLDVDFSYQNALTLNKFQGDVDLTKAAVTSAQFVKPIGLSLKGAMTAQGTPDQFNISQGSLNLGPLFLTASGKINSSPGGISDLHLGIPSTKLDGLEKLFPALAATPLTGRLEIQGTVHGDLKNPKTLSVNINPLNLEKVRGAINWESSDKTESIHGPLTLDGKIILVALGQKVVTALANIQADFSDLDISMVNQLQKNAHVPLRLSLKATQKGQALQITQSGLTTSAGVFNLKGSIQDPRSPKLNLILSVPKLDLAMLSKLLPILEPWKLGGFATAHCSLSGQYNLASGIEGSPLNFSGNITANIPKFVYMTKKAPQSRSTGAPSETNKVSVQKGAQPLLPQWPIMNTLKLTSRVKILNLTYNDLQISGLDLNLGIRNGLLTGSVLVASVFEGLAQMDKIQMQLLKAATPFSAQMTIKQLNIAEALAYGAPKWKDAAKGLGSGQMTMHVASPESKDFIGETNVSGHLQIKNGFLSTVSFDQYVNQKLSGIPGLGAKNLVNTKGTPMDVDTIFDFNHSILNLKTLDAVTPEKNELNVSGIIKVDQTLDLKGNVWLSPSMVSGDVAKCNADKSGRMVIPIHVSGTATNPQYNLMEGTAQQLIAKMASCQAEGLLKTRIQDEAKKSLLNLH